MSLSTKAFLGRGVEGRGVKKINTGNEFFPDSMVHSRMMQLLLEDVLGKEQPLLPQQPQAACGPAAGGPWVGPELPESGEQAEVVQVVVGCLSVGIRL